MIDTSKKISEVLIDAMRENGMTKAMLEKKAEMLWQTIMGPTVRNSTSSVRVRDGVMFVGLNSSVVREQLFLLKGKIIAALNKAVGEEVIKDIRFA